MEKVVPNSENPTVVFSLFETMTLSVSISPRNLYISLKSIKESTLLQHKRHKQSVRKINKLEQVSGETRIPPAGAIS